MSSRVLSVEDCQPAGFRWLTLKRITWEDPQGRQRLWESAERTTRRGAVDGVAIVAQIVREGQPPVLPVLKQYRPPLANYCLELPAGLVDAGESAAQAAVRELLEETGYTGRVVEATPICASDPGMSNANMQYAMLEVDGDAPENHDVKQQLEDGEFIQVELVPVHGLLQHLKEELQRSGCEVDARLLSFACGLEYAKQAAAAAAAAAAKAGHAAAQAAAAPAAATAGDGQPDGHAAAAGGGITLAAPQQAQEQAAVAVAGGASGSGQRTAPWRRLDSSASSAPPLAFGSPVVSAMGSDGSSMQPPAISLSASQGSAAGAAKSSRHLERQMPWGLHAWLLPFAVGAAAGTAGCWMLLARGRQH